MKIINIVNILSNNLSLNNYNKITNIFDDYNHIYKCHDPKKIFCFLTNNNKCEIEKCNYFNRIKKILIIVIVMTYH